MGIYLPYLLYRKRLEKWNDGWSKVSKFPEILGGMTGRVALGCWVKRGLGWGKARETWRNKWRNKWRNDVGMGGKFWEIVLGFF